MATEYVPAWAPHVVSVIGDVDDGEIVVEMFCRRCKTRYRRVCKSRQPRVHVRTFALVHFDCSPLDGGS